MNTDRLIREIEQRYNPDNDLGTPQVTFADYNLLLMVKDLQERVEALEKKIAASEPDPAYAEYNQIRARAGLPTLE